MIPYIETQLTSVRNYISAGIDAALTVVTAAIGDGLAPPRPLGYSINEIYELDQMPWIQVLPDIDNTDIANIKWDSIDRKVTIIIHVSTTSDIEACAQYIYRYAEAIRAIVKDNVTMGDSVIGWTIDNINYGTMSTQSNMFKQELWIHCNIKISE